MDMQSERKVSPAVANTGAAPPPERVARASRGLAIGIACAVAVIWLFVRLADEVMEHETQKLDAHVASMFYGHLTPPIHQFMAGVTWAADGVCQTALTVLVALILWVRRKSWIDSVTMLVAGFGEIGLDEGLKHIFHRYRPEPVFYHLGYSFPSGHSFAAVVVYGMIAYWLSQEAPRWRLAIWTVAVLLIILVGSSRVILAQHYLTDVIGGYLAGICWLCGCIVWRSILTSRRQPAAAAPGSAER